MSRRSIRGGTGMEGAKGNIGGESRVGGEMGQVGIKGPNTYKAGYMCWFIVLFNGLF